MPPASELQSCDNRYTIPGLDFSRSGYFPAMRIKVTKFFSYGLELVLKTNSPENWYGWTKECYLSHHDSGPSQLACLDASLTTSIFSQQKPEGTPPGYKVSGHKQDERRSWDIYPFSSKWLFSFFSSFSCGTFIVHIHMSLFLIYQYIFIDIYCQFLYQEQT